MFTLGNDNDANIRGSRWLTINMFVLQVIYSSHVQLHDSNCLACRVVIDNAGVVHLLEFLDEADIRKFYPHQAEREIKVLKGLDDGCMAQEVNDKGC